jgi:hypothetical protein
LSNNPAAAATPPNGANPASADNQIIPLLSTYGVLIANR